MSAPGRVLAGRRAGDSACGPAHFGRLAAVYRWMEYLSFGPYLKQWRELRLQEMTGAQHALVYGDGDGRFLAALIRSIPTLSVTAVDASAAMLRATAARLPAKARVALRQADALRYQPEGSFDLVVTHFFLDCFSEPEVAALLRLVRPAARPGCRWIVSDFALPRGRVARPLGWLVVRGLYAAFGLLTGLRTRRLPDHAGCLRAAGWVLEDRRYRLHGLLVSERWRLAAA